MCALMLLAIQQTGGDSPVEHDLRRFAGVEQVETHEWTTEVH